MTLPGENNVPPVREGVPPIVENPVTTPPLPQAPSLPQASPPAQETPETAQTTLEYRYDRDQPLPRPKFPQVGRIPETSFDIEFTPRQINTLRPHAFYGERVLSGVLIYPGLLIAYIEGSDGGTAVQTIHEPDSLTTSPLLVTAGAGSVICLKFDIDNTTYAISNVLVEVGTPGLVSAAIGGTCAVEIGTVTAAGFTQKLRSDFHYVSIYGV